MHRVISINLNGNAYQVEESGYTALVAYLERALAQLAGNPDQAEILKDLEQAIAEKCQRSLGPNKTVVTQQEVTAILQEMGPVDGSAGQAGPDATGAAAPGDGVCSGPARPRRLYRIAEGKVISGVCQGIAAYFDYDVAFVRLFFVLVTVFTGLGFPLYIVLIVVLPRAETPADRAAAYGQHTSAQELIDEAKRNYATFRASADSRRDWRRQKREWRRQKRAARWDPAWIPPRGPAGYASAIATGVIVPIFGVLNAVGVVVLVLALVSLFSTGAVFSWPIPDGVPHWVAAIGLIVAYQIVAGPLLFLRHAPYFRHGAVVGGGLAGAINSLVQLAILAFLIWLGYYHVPAVHDFIDQIPTLWQKIVPQ